MCTTNLWTIAAVDLKRFCCHRPVKFLKLSFLVSETGTSFHENYYFVQDQYIREVLGNSLVPKAMAPSDTVSLYFQPLTFINHQINLN
jgi:hypothetical protein